MASTIQVQLELADGNFTTRMMRAGQTVQQFTDQVARSSPALQALAAAGQPVVRSLDLADKAGTSFIGTLRDISIVAGVASMAIGKLQQISGGWITDIVKINASMQQLNFQLQSMARSSDPVKEAADNMAYLRAQALNMPFSLSAITNAFVQMKATGTDPMAGSLKGLADGVAAIGGTDDTLNRAVLAVTQMAGKGVIQMQELRLQLGQDMPRAVELMARSMGVSMAQFVKDISTGTIESKGALLLFNAELERSFGGQARLMMQTFAGQATNVTTIMQNLAQTVGGLNRTDGTYASNTFFGTMTTQLKDLVNLLSSTTANNFAIQLGAGLASLVNTLRGTLDGLIEFRNEIGRVALAVGGVLAFRTAIAGLVGLVSAVSSTRLAIMALSVNMAEMDSWMALSASASFSAGTGLIGLEAAAVSLGIGIKTLAVGFATVAPWLAAIGLGVYAAGEYFGWFSSKVTESYDSLKQFGAETRAQANETITAMETLLNSRIKSVEATPGWLASLSGNADADKKQLADLKQQLADLQKGKDELLKAAGQREDAKVLSDFQDIQAAKIHIIESAADKEMTAIQTDHDNQRGEAIRAGQSIDAIEADRKKKLLAAREDEADKIIGILQKSIASQQWAQLTGNEVTKAQAKQLEDYQTKQLLDQLNARNSLQSEMAMGEPVLPKAINEQALYDKGVKALETLQGAVAGLRGELTGANKDVVDLQTMLAQGKYGPEDTEKVKLLTDALIQAQTEKAKLDALMKGEKALSTDVENARIKALEEAAALQERATGKTLTDSEKVELKLKEGFYAGFGPASKVAQALQGITGMIDTSGTAATQVGNVLQNNTFSETTVSKINSTTEAITQLAGAITGVGVGLNGLDFGKFNGTDMIAGMAPAMQTLTSQMSDRMSQAMTMLMAKGWSKVAASGIVGNLAGESGIDPTKSGIDSNGLESGGIAQWNGDRLTKLRSYATMLGKSWTDLQTQVDYLDGELHSSEATAGGALSRATTSGEATSKFMSLFERPKDNSSAPARLGFAQQAMNLGAPGPALPTYVDGSATAANTKLLTDLQDKYNASLVATDALNEKNRVGGLQLNLAEEKKKLLEQIKTESGAVSDLNKNYLATVALIQKGKLGDNRDPTSDRYKELLADAKALDTLEKDVSATKAARSKSDAQQVTFDQKSLDLTQQAAEAMARIKDPLSLKSSAGYRALSTQLDKFITDSQDAYGIDSDNYKKAIDLKKQLLTQFRNGEILGNAATQTEQTRQLRQSLMTQGQQRAAALADEITQIDAQVAAFKGSEAEKIAVVKAAEERKAAIRAQYEQTMNPFIGQMQKWGDLQNNLIQASSGWLDSLAGGIGDLITGTNNFASILKGIAKDMATMAVKWAFSSLMNGMTGGSAGTGSSTGNFLTKLFGMAHTGAIIGSSSLASKMVSPAVFAGARRYHTGDIVGAPKLSAGEVPIIAKEGEGIFTPAQMKALGGFQQNTSLQIHAPITVSGSAGSNEQNADLAARMGRELEATMRGVVAEELQKATRPGNIANHRNH